MKTGIEILDEVIGQDFKALFGDNDTEWVLLAMEKYAKQTASLTPKDIVDFGNYILSPLRVQDIMKNPLYGDCTPPEIKIRLSHVRDTDLKMFTDHKKEN